MPSAALQDLASPHTSHQIDTRSRSLGRMPACGGATAAVTPPLAILLKAPRLGMVKTRLAAEVGDHRDEVGLHETQV